MADKKYKIVRDYVPPTDEEISEMMDFNAVSQQLTTSAVSNAMVLKVLLGLGAVGVAFSLLVYGLSPQSTESADVEILSEYLGLEGPVPVDRQLPDLVEMERWLVQRQAADDQTASVPDTARRVAQNAPVKKAAKKGSQQQEDSPVVVPNQFTDAAPVVGFDSLYRYLKESLVYPVEAPGDTIEGVVEIMFLVSKDGGISEPKVMTSLGEPFDQEALRVIKSMPPWNPARVNETAMSIRKQIAIQFRKLDARR